MEIWSVHTSEPCVCVRVPGSCMLNKTFNERALITARNWLVDRVSSSLSLLLMQITGSDYSDYTPTLHRHVAGRSKPRPLIMITQMWFACIQCLSEGQTFPPLSVCVLFRVSCPYIHTHSHAFHPQLSTAHNVIFMYGSMWVCVCVCVLYDSDAPGLRGILMTFIQHRNEHANLSIWHTVTYLLISHTFKLD